MTWRHTAKSAWQIAVAVGGCLIVLFLCVFLYGAFRVFFLKLVIPLGTVISETIGQGRWRLIKEIAAMAAPYAAWLAGACMILYLVRWVNRCHDPHYAVLPLSDRNDP
jgi:uncharacterized membrane protein